MSKFADITVDISHEKLDRSFQYKIPEELKEKLAVGMRVEIPFGKANRLIRGYITALTDIASYDPEKMKEIHCCVTDSTTEESNLIALAGWMKEQYGSTMIQALKTVLPVQDKAKAKEKKYVKLLISGENARQLLEDYKKKKYVARARLLEVLLEENRVSYERIKNELKVAPSVLHALEEKQILKIESEVIFRNPIKEDVASREIHYDLTDQQKEAVETILAEWNQESSRTVLLKGITGSGKTQVYMELIESMLQQKKQVIMLIPEIALTYQTVLRFYNRFGEKVSFLNSKMSIGERFDQFERAKNGQVQIMVGPRSALFTPFSHLGLIILDEEHETTYKSESVPRYHARDTAIYRAKIEHAHVILGSATPSIESYYRAKENEFLLVELKERYGESTLPEVKIIDMRQELRSGNRSILSIQLQEEIRRRLEKKEQVMLFLNRRGYAGFISCRECGEVIKCPHCDVSLSMHKNGKLVCHYCGYESKILTECPNCGSKYIGGFRAGTQQIEEIVKTTFPEAKVLRMDFDTTKNKGGHEEILSAFAQHKADILVGTQMIVKGHDFANVTLVGILAADMSLNSQGFRSSERTFQLITQAIGRAGRGKLKGGAIIQTYQPEHFCIQAASRQDYEEFYDQEMAYRMLMDYPPAASMMAVLGSCEDEKLLEQAMEYIKKYILRICSDERLKIIGPAYESVAKVNDIYREVLYLKHEAKPILIRIKDELERYIEINSGFRKIYIQFDFTV